jgi:DNA-binding NarL/FixJ family response regulator
LEKTKVLIVDDHTIFRSGLRMILEATGKMVVAAEAGSGREALEKVREAEPDIVLLDISLPDENGFNILKKLKSERESLPVLILTMHPEEVFAVRFLKAGAAGYLTKKEAPNELVEAIRKVMDGGKYVSHSLADKLADQIGTSARKAHHDSLSDREYQVMCMIASGMTLNEIADNLTVSINTVNSYRSRIIDKLNLENTTELIRYAVKHNLVD